MMMRCHVALVTYSLLLLTVLTAAHDTTRGDVVVAPQSPHHGDADGSIRVYNMSNKTVSVRSNIAGVLYATLALEAGFAGNLDCEFVWYELEFFEANTNRAICRTGTPVDVYCGNAVVLEYHSDTDTYTC